MLPTVSGEAPQLMRLGSMRRTWMLLAGVACALVLAVGPAEAIIGGQPAPQGTWPFAAFVQASHPDGTSGTCSGSVVSPSVVLTAAHCVVDAATNTILSPSAFTVVTGRTDYLAASGGQILGASWVAIHPLFTLSRLRGDVGLLQLAAPTTAPAVALTQSADASWAYARGTRILIAGWGLLSPFDTATPSQLYTVGLAAQSDAYCAGALPPLSYDPSTMFCGALPTLSEGVCNGDSGGPVAEQSPSGAWTEVGVTSWSLADCTPPDVFVRLASLQPWLSGEIGYLQATAPQPPSPPPAPTLPQSTTPVPLTPPQGPSTRPQQPADTAPPRVRAGASGGRPGQRVALRFWVADNSHRVRVRLEVIVRGRTVFHTMTAWLGTSPGVVWTSPWHMPKPGSTDGLVVRG